MNCADSTAAIVDEEVKNLLAVSYTQAKEMLNENRAILDRIADYLITRETITGEEFMKIFHKCKEEIIILPDTQAEADR